MENKTILISRSEIVQNLAITQDAVGDDVKTLRSWELGKIETEEAIKQIIRHNNMNRVSGISEEAFHDFARSLGYIRR